MRRRYVMIGIFISIVLVIALSLGFAPETSTVSAQEQTATIERQNLFNRIETSGTIAPERTINLTFGINGTVADVMVDVGDVVSMGDVLAQLDTADIDFQIALNEQAVLTREISLMDLTDEPTEAEIAQAQSSLASALSQLTQAQISLDNAVNNQTINCSSLDGARDGLDDATEAYDDYVIEGYEWDADFMPNPDSAEGQALEQAESQYDVALAQCNNTPPIAQFEAQVTAAEASVELAQATLDALLEGPTQNQIATAESQLEQAQLQLTDAQNTLADAMIVAPFDGVVSRVNIVTDQMVNTTTIAITLMDVDTLHIDVVVDELDIPQVQLEQSATIQPEALDGTIINGAVTQIAPAGTNTNGIVTYDVRIDLEPNVSLPIYVGMTTDVEIIVGQEADVLVIPTEAIQRDGIQEFVEVVNSDGSTTQVLIDTGLTIDGVTAIDGDISEGIEVLIPNRTASNSGGGLPFPGGN